MVEYLRFFFWCDCICYCLLIEMFLNEVNYEVVIFIININIFIIKNELFWFMILCFYNMIIKFFSIYIYKYKII